MKTSKLVLIAAGTGIASALLVIVFYSFISKQKPSKEENDHYSQVISEKYRIYSLPLPEKLDFAGEEVPLDQWDVRENWIAKYL